MDYATTMNELYFTHTYAASTMFVLRNVALKRAGLGLLDVPRDHVCALHFKETSGLFEFHASFAWLQQEPCHFVTAEFGETWQHVVLAALANPVEKAVNNRRTFSPMLMAQEEPSFLRRPGQCVVFHKAIVVAVQPVRKHKAWECHFDELRIRLRKCGIKFFHFLARILPDRPAGSGPHNNE